MVTRIAIAAILIVAGSSFAAAQSAMPAPKPAPPMTSAPAANTTQPTPPPANSAATQNGIRVGNDAVNGEPLEVKRVK